MSNCGNCKCSECCTVRCEYYESNSCNPHCCDYVKISCDCYSCCPKVCMPKPNCFDKTRRYWDCKGYNDCTNCKKDCNSGYGIIKYLNDKSHADPEDSQGDTVNNTDTGYFNKCSSCYSITAKPYHDTVFKTTSARSNHVHEAISHICGNKCIIWPEFIFSKDTKSTDDAPFIFDYMTQTSRPLNVCNNGIYSYRITDATDVDPCGYVYLLSINFNDTPEAADYMDNDNQFRSIIKARLTGNTVTFLSSHDIPVTRPNSTPNFEGIAKICENEFLVVADDFTSYSGEGLVYVIINGDDICAYELDLCIGGKSITSSQFNKMKFSSASNTEIGIGLIPENPLNNQCVMPVISCQSLMLARKCIGMGSPCISVDAYLIVFTLYDLYTSDHYLFAGVEGLTIAPDGTVLGLAKYKCDPPVSTPCNGNVLNLTSLRSLVADGHKAKFTRSRNPCGKKSGPCNCGCDGNKASRHPGPPSIHTLELTKPLIGKFCQGFDFSS